MKINKKITLILSALILVFSLAACGKTPAPVEPEVSQDLEQEPVVDADVEEPIIEEELDLGVDADEEEPMIEEPDANLDPIDAMIDSSNYIAKIKLIKKGEDKTELKVLDSIKGNVSTSDLPTINSLELNRAYVVFLKDVDGAVVLTDEAKSLVLLEGDNHELFEKINKKVHTSN